MNFGQIFERRFERRIKRRAENLGAKRRTLNIELLEDRRLLAFTATLVDDLTAGPTNTFDPNFGTSDGGTDELVAVGDDLFFRSRKLFSANDLYVVDSGNVPTAPTKLSTQGGFNPTNVNGSVFFYEDVVTNTTLWQTDGTPAGTSQVLDIDDTFSFTLQSAEVNGKLIFVNADKDINGDTITGVELWVFDPSGSAPTGPLLDIRAGVNSSRPVFHGTTGGKLYFTAENAEGTFGLFATDGTVAGTEQIIADVGGTTTFENFVDWNGEVAFLAQTGDGAAVGDTLYRSDGTAAGTSQIVTPTLVNDGSANGVESQASLVAIGTNLYFTAANNSGGGIELWQFDGTNSQKLTNKHFSSAPANLIVFEGDIFFTADDGATGNELWRSDLSAGGAALQVADINVAGSSDPSFLTLLAGNLFFVADDGDSTGRELRFFDPGTSTVGVVDTIVPGIGSALPRSLVVVDAKLFFTADRAFDGRELWAVNEDGGEIGVEDSLGTQIADGGGLFDFGTVSTNAGTGTQTFTILNTGNSALTLTGPNPVSITGPGIAEFTVTSQPTSLVIAPGSSTDFTIEFDPSASGLVTATVNIANDDLNESPFDFTIQGTGQNPGDIQLKGNGLVITNNDFDPETADGTDFGTTEFGDLNSQGFTITNSGEELLTLTGASPVSITGLDPGDFNILQQPTDLELDPGESTTFTVRFNPQAVGQRVAAIVVTSDDIDEPDYFFGVIGIGQIAGPIPEIQVLGNNVIIVDGDITPGSPDGTSFGTVGVADSASATFTIKNVGGDTLNLTGPEPITLTGTDAAEYTVVSQPAVLSLAPGESTTFQVAFLAAGLGVREATINIANDDPDENPFDFSIQTQVTPQLTNKWVSQGAGPGASGDVQNILPNNPVTGAIDVVLAHPVNPNILYIGAVNGGIWKTINATATTPTWTPLTDFQASLSISALAFDLSDLDENTGNPTYNTIVAGVGLSSTFASLGGTPSGVLRTTDGGANWNSIPGASGLNITSIAASGDHIAVTASGFFGGIFTTDVDDSDGDGNTSEFLLREGGAYTDMVQSPSDLSVLYAAGPTGSKRSSDHGETWNTVDGGPIGATDVRLAIHPGDAFSSERVFVGGINEEGFARISFSDDGGPFTDMGAVIVPRLPFDANDSSRIIIEGAEINPTMDATSTALKITGHGFAGGERIFVVGVEGVDANGLWEVALVVDEEGDPNPDFIELVGSEFGGSYDKGGEIFLAEEKVFFGQLSLGVDPGGDPNKVYFGASGGEVYRGDTSVPVPLVTPNMLSAPLPLPWSPIFGTALALPSFVNADLTLPEFANFFANFYPDSGTGTDSIPHSSSRDITFDSLGSLIQSDDGGIYLRTIPTSAAGDWKSLVGNIQVGQITEIAYDTISDTIIAGLQDTGTQYQFTPDRSDWFTLATGNGRDVAVDSTTLAAQGLSIRYSSTSFLGFRGSLRRTIWDNQGNLVSSALPFLSPLPASPGVFGQLKTPLQLNNVNPQQMLIGGSNGLFISTDQGETVTLLVPNLVATGNSTGNAIDFGGRNANGTPNLGVAYVGTNDGNVWVRTNSNDVFVANQPGVGTPIRDVIMNTKDASEAFASDSNHVYMTSNFGQAWDDITGDLFTLIDSTGHGIDYFRSLEFMEGINNNTIVVGTNIGVFAMLTSAPGEWFEVGTDLPNAPVWDLDYDKEDDVLVVGTLGRGAWKLTGLGADIGASVNQLLVTQMQDENDGNFLTGDLSFREAIELSNLTDGVQTIKIDPSFDGGTLLATLGAIDITSPVIIDASNLTSFTFAANDPTPLLNNGDGSRLFNITDGNDAVSFNVELIGVTLTGGDVTGSGGAIASRENLTLTGVTFTDNHATTSGGALSHDQGSLTITNSLFENNSNGIGHGGAIVVSNAQGNVLIEDTTVRFNSSLGDGGGVDFLGGAGNALINRSTINNNTATNRGAGVWADRPVNIVSSTISGNVATSNGGGIWSNHSLNVSNTTITGNQTTGIGGGVFVENSSSLATISHTIIAGNIAPSPRAPDLGVGPTRTVDIHFSLVGESTGSGLTETAGTPDANGNSIGGTGIAAINAQLGPLADNSGATQTHFLLSGSPAIDAGDQNAAPNVNGIPLTDQRGVTFRRVADSTGGFNDRIDIGSIELDPVGTSDFNRDQIVDLADYTIWQDAQGSTTDLKTDANTDGVVDQADYALWKQHFGDTWTLPTASVTSGATSTAGGGATVEAAVALAVEPEVKAVLQSAPELTGIVEVAALLEVENEPAAPVATPIVPLAEPTESSELAFAQISTTRSGYSLSRRNALQSETAVDQVTTDAALLVLATEVVPTDSGDDFSRDVDQLSIEKAFGESDDSEHADSNGGDDWLSYLSLDQPVS